MPIDPVSRGFLGEVGRRIAQGMLSHSTGTCPVPGRSEPIIKPGWLSGTYKEGEFFCCGTTTCYNCFLKFLHGTKKCPMCNSYSVPCADGRDGNGNTTYWPNELEFFSALNRGVLTEKGVPRHRWCSVCTGGGVAVAAA